MTTDHSRSSRVFARFRAIDPFNYGFLVSVYNPDFADTVHEREQGKALIDLVLGPSQRLLSVNAVPGSNPAGR